MSALDNSSPLTADVFYGQPLKQKDLYRQLIEYGKFTALHDTFLSSNIYRGLIAINLL